jgi:hypothetical protein
LLNRYIFKWPTWYTRRQEQVRNCTRALEMKFTDSRIGRGILSLDSGNNRYDVSRANDSIVLFGTPYGVYVKVTTQQNLVVVSTTTPVWLSQSRIDSVGEIYCSGTVA